MPHCDCVGGSYEGTAESAVIEWNRQMALYWAERETRSVQVSRVVGDEDGFDIGGAAV